MSTKSFTFDLADDPASRVAGLKNVSNLPMGHGMLFVFDQPQALRFTMQDVLIPLDIAFIDANGIIRKVERMAPGVGAIYDSGVPCKMALEVSAGQLAAVDVGQRAFIDWASKTIGI